MKKIILIVIWIVCLSNMYFFSDIIYNYCLDNETSQFSGASTGELQYYFSIFMDAMCILMLSIYTIVLTEKKLIKEGI